MDIRVGQVLEFVHPVNVEGRTIAPGTRVRVGHILTELMEPKLTLVMLGKEEPATIVVDHRIAGVHCRIVSENS